MTRIDHLVWAAPDLGRAIDELQARTGARAAPSAALAGSAVLGLGPRSYLEVRAAPSGPPAATLHGFAVATDRLDRVAAKLEQAGQPPARIVPMSRQAPNGRLVRWRLLIPANHAYGPLTPTFIDWGDGPHPSEAEDQDCRLTSLSLRHPEAWSLRPLLERLGVDTPVAAGPAELCAELATPKGVVRLSSRDHLG